MGDKYKQPDLPLDPHHAQVYDVDGTPISVADLAFTAHNSLYGQFMDGQDLRFWGNFGYDRETMLEDLGPDVHPIGHQNETWRQSMLMLEADPNHGFNGEQIGILMLTNRIHDMGESMHPRIVEQIGRVVGDIPAGKKTDSERLAEQRVRQFIWNELYPDIHPEVVARCEALIMHQPLEGDEQMHEHLEVAHDLSTFETAVRAKQTWDTMLSYHHGEVMDIRSNDGGRSSGVLGLHRSVFSRSGLRLLDEYSHHPQVQVALAPHMEELARYKARQLQLAA